MNPSAPGPTPADEDPSAIRRQRLRFELLFASAWLALGLFALPAAIFAVGQALLGPYGEGGGLGRFYANFFADLAEPAGRAWALALGPLLLVTLVRLVFIGVQRAPSEPAAPQNDAPPRREPPPPQRIEPRLGPE